MSLTILLVVCTIVLTWGIVSAINHRVQLLEKSLDEKFDDAKEHLDDRTGKLADYVQREMNKTRESVERFQDVYEKDTDKTNWEFPELTQ